MDNTNAQQSQTTNDTASNIRIYQQNILPGVVKPRHVYVDKSPQNGDMYYSDTTDFQKISLGTNGQVLTLSNGIPAWANGSGAASNLLSATTTINIGSATAPTAGQVLTASSGTVATWKTPGGVHFATSGAQADFSTNAGTAVDITGATVTISPTSTVTANIIVTGRYYTASSNGNITFNLLADGVSVQTYDVNPGTTAIGMSLALSGQVSLASGSRVIKVQLNSNSGAVTAHADQINVSVMYM